MRAQLLLATTFASGLILLGVACGTETVYVYEDAGAAPTGTSSGTSGTKASSGTSGKSSSGTSGKGTSGTSGSGDDDDDDDDDDTTSSSSSSSSSSGSSSSSSGSTTSSSSSGGSSSGFAVMPSTKLVDDPNAVLLAIVGDDAIYRLLTASGTPTPVYAIPIAGGTATKLWELGATDSQAINGLVLGHWSGIANGVGNLEVWSRASGLKTGIATSSLVGLIRGSADGTRIAFGQEATITGNKPVSTNIGVRGIGDATNLATLSGPAGTVNLAATNCKLQASFAGGVFFAEFCNGVTTTQTLARLVTLPAVAAPAFARIDAADLDAANTLAGTVNFSTSADGTKVVAASLGASTNTGKVYKVATPGTGIITLDALPNTIGGTLYTMSADGNHVIYRAASAATPAAAADLKAAVVTASPATVKTLSAGVLSVTGFSLDGHALMFNKLARDAATGLLDVNLVDFSVAAPAPAALIADAKGLPLGFTGNSAQAVFLDGSGLPNAPPTMKSVPVAGGATKTVVATGGPVGARAATVGTGYVFFTNLTNGTASLPTVVDINYVDAVTPLAPKKISSGVPLSAQDNEFFVSGKKVVYTRLLPAGDEGIYTVTLP